MTQKGLIGSRSCDEVRRSPGTPRTRTDEPAARNDDSRAVGMINRFALAKAIYRVALMGFRWGWSKREMIDQKRETRKRRRRGKTEAWSAEPRPVR